MRIRAVTLMALLSLTVVAPVGASELDDSWTRVQAAASDAPGAYTSTALDPVDYAAWYALDYVPSHLGGNWLCSTPGKQYAHQSRKDLSPVAIIPAKDIVEVDGTCVSPYPTASFNVQLGYEVCRFVIGLCRPLWRGQTQEFPSVAGQGHAVGVDYHLYDEDGEQPTGMVKFCAWYIQPEDTSANMSCTLPFPMV